MSETESAPGFAVRRLYRRWRAAAARGVNHGAVMASVIKDGGWNLRYGFMILMSAGIAVLGLLLSSPAVVIGAMLISPLMSPILGFGFNLAVFDFREMRRSLTALALGSAAAILFAALVVLVSPLKVATAEILSRTKPNLFDLLVALFAALAGSFAVIRGKGETIVGVAIATALMPPLAVVGYGWATWNLPVLTGSLALFGTNFVTIALSATVIARLYGFGSGLSGRQTLLQTVLLVLVFVAMAVPLALALGRIAREAVVVNAVRGYLEDRFGARARISQLNVDFEAHPITVRAVVIAPRARALTTNALQGGLEQRLKQPARLEVDQVLLGAGADSLAAQRASLQQADTVDHNRVKSLTAAVAVIAGVNPDRVMVDEAHMRASAPEAVLPNANLAVYQALEARARQLEPGWDVVLTPPLQTLPTIRFAYGSDVIDAPNRALILSAGWAALRWNAPALRIPGLPQHGGGAHPGLNARRALAVAAILSAEVVAVQSAPGGGQVMPLSAPLAAHAPRV